MRFLPVAQSQRFADFALSDSSVNPDRAFATAITAAFRSVFTTLQVSAIDGQHDGRIIQLFRGCASDDEPALLRIQEFSASGSAVPPGSAGVRLPALTHSQETADGISTQAPALGECFRCEMLLFHRGGRDVRFALFGEHYFGSLLMLNFIALITPFLMAILNRFTVLCSRSRCSTVTCSSARPVRCCHTPKSKTRPSPIRLDFAVVRDHPSVVVSRLAHMLETYRRRCETIKPGPYFPPSPEMVNDKTVPIVLVEAEKSVLALTAWSERTGREDHRRWFGRRVGLEHDGWHEGNQRRDGGGSWSTPRSDRGLP